MVGRWHRNLMNGRSSRHDMKMLHEKSMRMNGMRCGRLEEKEILIYVQGVVFDLSGLNTALVRKISPGASGGGGGAGLGCMAGFLLGANDFSSLMIKGNVFSAQLKTSWLRAR